MCGSREWYLGFVSFHAWRGTHSVVCFHQYTAYHHCCFYSLCVCLSIRRDEGHGLPLYFLRIFFIGESRIVLRGSTSKSTFLHFLFCHFLSLFQSTGNALEQPTYVLIPEMPATAQRILDNFSVFARPAFLGMA